MTDSPLVNTRFGQYYIQEKLGTGGMASVFRALTENQQEVAALKILHAAWSEHAEIVRRFKREAEIANRLRHAHIVAVKDHGVVNGRPYLAMDYMPGGTLAQRFKQPADISPQYVVRLLRNVGSAFDYAHRQGIIHRDVKLENILLDERGNACLSDFGVARVMDATHYTATGNVFGTPLYMSPEQASGRPDVDYRADLYSLAVVAYLLVAGRFPFMAKDMLAILNQHVYAQPPFPSVVNPELPPAIDEVLLRALEKNPADRYPSADMFVEAFAKVMSEKGPRLLHIDLWSQVSQDTAGEPVELPSMTADDYYEAAKTAKTRDEAIGYLKKALQVDPWHTKANRALIKLEREKYGAAPAPSQSLNTEEGSKTLPVEVSVQEHQVIEAPKAETPVDLLPEKKRSKPRSKRANVWGRVGCWSFLLLALASSYFVVSVLGLGLAGVLAGLFTGSKPVQEIDGVPIQEIENAPLIVPPSSSKETFNGNREVDILQAGYNQEFVFSANEGDEIAIYVQFISPLAKNATRNVAVITPYGEDGRYICTPNQILQDGSGVVYECDINITGAWKVRIFGREGESSGAYFFGVERLDQSMGSIPLR